MTDDRRRVSEVGDRLVDLFCPPAGPAEPAATPGEPSLRMHIRIDRAGTHFCSGSSSSGGSAGSPVLLTRLAFRRFGIFFPCSASNGPPPTCVAAAVAAPSRVVVSCPRQKSRKCKGERLSRCPVECGRGASAAVVATPLGASWRRGAGAAHLIFKVLHVAKQVLNLPLLWATVQIHVAFPDLKGAEPAEGQPKHPQTQSRQAG